MKFVILILFFAAVVGAFYLLGGDRYLDISELNQALDSWRAQIHQNEYFYAVMTGLIFILIMSTPLPVTAVSILSAGYLFGFVLGLTVILCSTLIAATFTFVLCRFALGESIKERANKVFKAAGAELENGGFWYALSLRLSALVPFFLLNSGQAITPITLRDFMLATLLGMIPVSMVLVNAGTQLAEIRNIADVLSPQLMLSFALVALLPLLIRAILVKTGKFANQQS